MKEDLIHMESEYFLMELASLIFFVLHWYFKYNPVILVPPLFYTHAASEES